MEFNAIFNNISVISWQSVLLMEETEIINKKKCTKNKLKTHINKINLGRVEGI
jgi:hypothetical protein